MEQWEKEYLEIVERQKERQANAVDKPSEGKISKGWKEVIREDGSKWYVPDEAVLSRQERRMKRKKGPFQCGRCLFVGLKRLIRLMLMLGMIGLFCVIWKGVGELDINIPWKLPSIHSSAPARNTYVNGLGLHNMAKTLFDIRERQTNTLNAYISDGGFSLDEIKTWQDSIDNDLAIIQNLEYDESYSEVVYGYARLLNILDDFVDCVLIGDSNRAREAWTEYSELFSSLNGIFAEALDANGVEYVIDENSLYFRYSVY